MLRKKDFRKICTGAMLVVFCVVILFSQAASIKINNAKFCKASLLKQPVKGPGGGSLTNENQTNPIEEEDDDFELESTLLKAHRHDFFIIRHYTFQQDLIRDPHREIFSPPPQI